jgi:hypothetical protein
MLKAALVAEVVKATMSVKAVMAAVAVPSARVTKACRGEETARLSRVILSAALPRSTVLHPF